ncbi:MAG: S8 family serine peptidase [Candidatus Eisenbacteria bacterium]|nr:S8 family serine peptidase [Candidatus Latescibacterota bacterium]MBD3303112.1 S8 family serine peptidase [Candidatus Eisenbacteria bacterium]
MIDGGSMSSHRPVLGRLLSPLLLLAGLLWLSSASPGRAGELDPEFATTVARASTDASLSGLVMLRAQPDLEAVERRLTTLGQRSRWRRHQHVVAHAQELAARTQADLLVHLESLRSSGRVQSVQSFWVSNLVVVDAIPEVFLGLADRDDVGTIYENGAIELREGLDAVDLERDAGIRELPDALVCVNVGPAWDLGYRGHGRVVADFDTGADADHPALADRWRGAQEGVAWWEAWKDPYTDTTYPYDAGTHGTHTLGIMVAEEPDGTPIGVAPEARWIAAGILIGFNVSHIIECYQWAVDPDGNPGTIEDVPDVINNSWGTSHDCDQTFWNAIDVVEAAGIVNTIAVDNTGPGYATVNSPESRAASPTVNFGVGNVNPHVEGYPISVSSGRGPSPCDDAAIKPEITGPGTSIYSTLPGGNYGTKTGTSMACPHVSGAVAILRQVNPDLTVEEIKTILMETAFDRGDPGEDNAYGWGIVDVGSAVEAALGTLPLLPPRNLVAETIEQDVRLTWEPPEELRADDPLLAYRIYRAPLDEPFGNEPISEIASFQSNLVYTDPDLPEGSYHYVVTARYASGESGPSNEATAFLVPPAGAEEAILGAGGAGLHVAPNPFNPATIVRYTARVEGPLLVTVHDAGGAHVKTLVRAERAGIGEQAVVWDGTNDEGREVASGTYFVRLEQTDRIATRCVSLLK